MLRSKIGIFLAIICINCYFLYADTKNALFYLKQQAQTLESYYQQVKKQSLLKDYPTFRGRKLIEHSVYLQLDNAEKSKLIGELVLSDFVLKDFIKYSHLGGIGVAGVLADEAREKKSRVFYLKFDGRYLSDIESLGFGSELYAYCVLPDFNHCILLGIGEDW